MLLKQRSDLVLSPIESQNPAFQLDNSSSRSRTRRFRETSELFLYSRNGLKHPRHLSV